LSSQYPPQIRLGIFAPCVILRVSVRAARVPSSSSSSSGKVTREGIDNRLRRRQGLRAHRSASKPAADAETSSPSEGWPSDPVPGRSTDPWRPRFGWRHRDLFCQWPPRHPPWWRPIFRRLCIHAWNVPNVERRPANWYVCSTRLQLQVTGAVGCSSWCR